MQEVFSGVRCQVSDFSRGRTLGVPFLRITNTKKGTPGCASPTILCNLNVVIAGLTRNLVTACLWRLQIKPAMTMCHVLDYTIYYIILFILKLSFSITANPSRLSCRRHSYLLLRKRVYLHQFFCPVRPRYAVL